MIAGGEEYSLFRAELTKQFYGVSKILNSTVHQIAIHNRYVSIYNVKNFSGFLAFTVVSPMRNSKEAFTIIRLKKLLDLLNWLIGRFSRVYFDRMLDRDECHSAAQ